MSVQSSERKAHNAKLARTFCLTADNASKVRNERM